MTEQKHQECHSEEWVKNPDTGRWEGRKIMEDVVTEIEPMAKNTHAWVGLIGKDIGGYLIKEPFRLFYDDERLAKRWRDNLSRRKNRKCYDDNGNEHIYDAVFIRRMPIENKIEK